MKCVRIFSFSHFPGDIPSQILRTHNQDVHVNEKHARDRKSWASVVGFSGVGDLSYAENVVFKLAGQPNRSRVSAGQKGEKIVITQDK